MTSCKLSELLIFFLKINIDRVQAERICIFCLYFAKHYFFCTRYFLVLSPGGVVCDDGRLADLDGHVLGDLVVDADDDLALVDGLVRPLDVLDLEGERRAGRVITHAGQKRKIYFENKYSRP